VNRRGLAGHGDNGDLLDDGASIARDPRWVHERAPRDARGHPVVPQHRDLEVLQSLWRGGFLTLKMIAHEWWPDQPIRLCQRRMKELADVGWIARYRPRRTARGGSYQYVYYLTASGFRLGQRALGPDGPYISPDARWRDLDVLNHNGVVHDLEAHAWILAYRRAARERLAAWLGPREARVEVPTKPKDGRREPITLADVRLPRAQRVDALQADHFTPLVPDATVELRNPETGRELDLLIEFDRTGRAAKNIDKLLRGDALICAWWRLVPRWRALNQPPVLIFVCPSNHHLHALMRAADRVVTGRLATPGTPTATWPYPGRKRLRFCVAAELLNGSPRARRLPDQPTDSPLEQAPLELRETWLPGTQTSTSAAI
jgi:Replication-relaxation